MGAVKQASPARAKLERSLYYGSAGIRRYQWTLFRYRNVKRIDVNDAGIIVDSGHSREAYAFSDVEKLSFQWIPGLLFHVRFLMKDGRKLVLPSVVERLDYALDLAASARPELVDHSSFDFYRRVAISLDHSWARYGQNYSRPWKVAGRLFARYAFSLIALFGISSVGQTMGVLPQIESFSKWVSWTADALVLSTIPWTLSYFACETYLFFGTMKRLRFDPYAVKRQMLHEAEVRDGYLRWTYAGALVLAFVFAAIAGR